MRPRQLREPYAGRSVLLRVDDRIRLVSPSSLPPEVEEKLRARFEHDNPGYASAKAMLERPGLSRRARAMAYGRLASTKAIDATWRVDGEAGDRSPASYPRGGLIEVRETLEDFGFEVEVEDARTEGSPEFIAWLKSADLAHALELRGYQQEAVDSILEQEQGLVRAPTGCGKTCILIAAIARSRLPAIVFVDSVALAEQWTSRLREELGLGREHVGLLGDGKNRVLPITVAIVGSARRRLAELAPLFGFAAFDEVHSAAAKSVFECVDAMPARFRVGVSDDERRKDRREYLIRDVFGGVLAEVDRKRIVAEGAIFDVDVRFLLTHYTPAWWRRLPEQERPTRFEMLIDDMGEDDARNDQIADDAAELALQGEKVLVFAHRVAHCEKLAALIGSKLGADLGEPRAGVGLLLGTKQRAHEFAETCAGLLDGSVSVAVGTYEAVGQSIDLPSVTVGVCATPCHTNRSRFQQARGRICRRPDGKKTAELRVWWDEDVFGFGPVEAVARMAPGALVPTPEGWVTAREMVRARRAERKAAG